MNIRVIFMLMGLAISCSKLAANLKLESAFDALKPIVHGINPSVLKLALKATQCAQEKGIRFKPILTILDYSKPSINKRLWIIDLKSQKELFRICAAHGQKTGGNIAHNFSNNPDSHQSSVGLFVARHTYIGKHGLSLHLHGLENHFNDNAEKRHIVLHGANYVSENFIRHHGRLGRSWGCPAINPHYVKPVIETIKDGGLLFAYAPQSDWLSHSHYLHCEQDKDLKGGLTQHGTTE